MKNLIKLTSSIVIAVIMVITMNNCRKTDPSSAEMENPNDQTELIEKSKAMQEHILAFKAKMKYFKDNPNLKAGGELYTADSAVIELESLLNYDSCFISVECNQTTFEVSEIIMPLDEIEKINDPDLMQVYYDKVIDTIMAQMGRVDYNMKKLLLVDLEYTGTNSNGDAIVSVGVLIGNQGLNHLLPDNDWFYGDMGGVCETGQYWPEDAASQLNYRVTATMLPDPPNGSGWWFRNVTSTYINPTSDPLNPLPANYLDYKIFYAVDNPTAIPPLTVGDDEKCLSAYEMGFYKNHYVAYAQAEESGNIKFARCLIEGNSYNNPYRIQHDYTIFVGERLILWHE